MRSLLHDCDTGKHCGSRITPSLFFCIAPNINILKTLRLDTFTLAHAGLFWCFYNPSNSDMDYRIFNVRMWSFCFHLHAGPTIFHFQSSASSSCLERQHRKLLTCFIDLFVQSTDHSHNDSSAEKICCHLSQCVASCLVVVVHFFLKKLL